MRESKLGQILPAISRHYRLMTFLGEALPQDRGHVRLVLDDKNVHCKPRGYSTHFSTAEYPLLDDVSGAVPYMFVITTRTFDPPMFV